MPKKHIFKRKLILGGIIIFLLAVAAVFFSTPWRYQPAPKYISIPNIRLELETEPSHFTHRLSVTAYNDGNETWECDNHLILEYYHHGEWHTLSCPFFGRTPAFFSDAVILPPGESESYDMLLDYYGYFMRSGHYRAVLIGDPFYPDDIHHSGAVSVEFDI